MDRFDLLLATGQAINLVSPLLPPLAHAIHRARRPRYQALPWMARLAALVGFDLAVNWIMLGMALGHLRNAWVADLRILPGFALALWVLDGVGPRPLPRPLLGGAAAASVAAVAWDAGRIGLGGKWPLALALTEATVLGISLWRLKEHLVQDGTTPAFRQPAFWLLGTLALTQSVWLTFDPMFNLFLQRLSREWILVPWFAKYLFGLFANMALARTFLCPNPSSS